MIRKNQPNETETTLAQTNEPNGQTSLSAGTTQTPNRFANRFSMFEQKPANQAISPFNSSHAPNQFKLKKVEPEKEKSEKLNEKSNDKANEKVNEKAVEGIAESTNEKSNENINEKPNEKTVEKSIEKTGEDSSSANLPLSGPKSVINAKTLPQTPSPNKLKSDRPPEFMEALNQVLLSPKSFPHARSEKNGESSNEASSTTITKPLPPVPSHKVLKSNLNPSSKSTCVSELAEPHATMFVKLKPINGNNTTKKSSLDSNPAFNLPNGSSNLNNNNNNNNNNSNNSNNHNTNTLSTQVSNVNSNHLIVNEFNTPIGITLLTSNDDESTRSLSQRRKNDAEKRSSVREIVQMLSEESKVRPL